MQKISNAKLTSWFTLIEDYFGLNFSYLCFMIDYKAKRKEIEGRGEVKM